MTIPGRSATPATGAVDFFVFDSASRTQHRPGSTCRFHVALNMSGVCDDLSRRQTEFRRMLEELSRLSTTIIAASAAVHAFAFWILWMWARRDLRRIASDLEQFTRPLRQRSVLDGTRHLSDQAEAFLADVGEVLGNEKRRRERRQLLERITILDERRGYFHSLWFDTWYAICRNMVEAYPLAGVLGTILAIGAALQTPTAEAQTVSTIVTHFGDAIWSTFAGLVAAIGLMLLNSAVESFFQRLDENRLHVREMIARAKSVLAMDAGDEACDASPAD